MKNNNSETNFQEFSPPKKKQGCRIVKNHFSQRFIDCNCIYPGSLRVLTVFFFIRISGFEIPHPRGVGTLQGGPFRTTRATKILHLHLQCCDLPWHRVKLESTKASRNCTTPENWHFESKNHLNKPGSFGSMFLFFGGNHIFKPGKIWP